MGLLPNDARRAALSASLLASSLDGEVVAAARALCGLLAKGGLDPRTVVTAGLTSDAISGRATPPVTTSGSWKQRARMARLSPYLNDWERDFLSDILGHGSLSQRQESCLKAILRKSEGEQL